MKCPKCHTLNVISSIDNYAVDADALKCFSCGKISWIDPEYFSDALDEAIITIGKSPASNSALHGHSELGEIKIREASSEDLEVIYNIYREVNETNTLDKSLNYSKDELFSYLPEICVIYTDSKGVLGFFLIFDMGIWGYLDIFCVSPAFRRCGAGKKVVEYLDQMAQDKSWRIINTLVEPENFKTAAYLDKHGYNCYAAMLYQSKIFKEKI